MAEIKSSALFEAQIRSAVEDSIALMGEEIIDKAQAELRLRLREEVGRIAVRLARDVDFQSMEDRLRIEVRHK